MARYVGVNSNDPEDKVIKLGPLNWDGVTPYNPGDGLLLLLEAEALEQGYTWPSPEGGVEEPPAEIAE
ncbi:hypothetical protein ACFO9E_18180 [Streptomyces maoxianensis]|uniref:Uncharacterized protein n=1 Tax=Streptomyces maoxianensis TaxID=1459942 RepID=A0ABV9G9V0_9ACTN